MSEFAKRVLLQAVDQKAEVPDNAVSIQSRSEAPEDAEVVEGERGGLYYVPSGEGEDGSDDKSAVPGKADDMSDEEIEENVSAIISGVDLSDVEESEFGDPILSAAAKEQLKKSIAESFGEEATEAVYDNIGSWKNKSYTDKGQRLEKAFAESVGVDENIRNNTLDGGDPSRSEVAVANALRQASQEFIRENYGDNIELHRGLSEFGAGQIVASWLNSPSDEEFDFSLSAMSNFSIFEELANDFAGDRLTFTTEVDADEVLFATDMLEGPQGIDEGEISIQGVDRNIGAMDTEVFGGGPLPLEVDGLDSERAERMMGTIENEVDSISNVLTDEGKENLKALADEFGLEAPKGVL